ncbi:hypothetical protein IL306_013979 [Fusarium sp. DS 682]|nr:hypothetical protein IL306_013979 [Fusarium sp. DS 682]
MHLKKKTTLSNADLLRYVRDSPARRTVLKDSQDIFKAFIAVEGCPRVETYLRNIEFNTLGIDQKHVLKNAGQAHMNAFVTDQESTHETRHLVSQPDLLYGWIPAHFMADNHGIPAWSKREAQAIEGTGLFYPFLVVKFASDALGQSDSYPKGLGDCLQGASIGVRMVERLRHRLAERGYHDGGAHLKLNSSVYSILLSKNKACIAFTYAWDETSEHVYILATFDMHNEEDQKQCGRLISNILYWGATDRLQSIRSAIRLIESRGLTWYPRYC